MIYDVNKLLVFILFIYRFPTCYNIFFTLKGIEGVLLDSCFWWSHILVGTKSI
jgi:hypothetical protein